MTLSPHSSSEIENKKEKKAAKRRRRLPRFLYETFWPVNCVGSKCFHPSPSVFDVENIEFIWIISPGTCLHGGVV